MRIARWIAAILFLLPLAQLARGQPMDAKSVAQLRRFQLNDDVMQRYDDLVHASTISRVRRSTQEAWPAHPGPPSLPGDLDDAAAMLASSDPIGPMLREHHLSSREYLSVLLIRMGASESLRRERLASRSPGARIVVPPPSPWVSPENLHYLQTKESREQSNGIPAER